VVRTPLLEVRGVALRYKTREHLVTATYRVDFTVLQSDRFVLLPPSGCGKSTLLKAVGGIFIRRKVKLRSRAKPSRSPDPIA